MRLMRVVLVLATLLVVALAGCVSEDDPEPATSGTQGDTAARAPATMDAEIEDAEPVMEEVKVIVPYVEVFTGSGSTSTGAWVCDDTSGAGECQGQELEAHSRFITYDYADQLIAATFEITWERVDSTTRLLVAQVTATPAGGDAEIIAVAYDTSPLVIDLPELAAGAGTLEIEVWPRSDAGAGPAFVFVDPATQPFDLTGTLTMMPAA